MSEYFPTFEKYGSRLYHSLRKGLSEVVEVSRGMGNEILNEKHGVEVMAAAAACAMGLSHSHSRTGNHLYFALEILMGTFVFWEAYKGTIEPSDRDRINRLRRHR